MTEMVFQIEEAPEGGWTARGIGESIFTEADDLDHLRDQIRQAVDCHFENPKDRPSMIRLN